MTPDPDPDPTPTPDPAPTLDLLRDLFGDHDRWRASCTGVPPAGPSPGARALLRDLSARLARDSTPWPAPGHLSHMTADTPLDVTLAYLCALLYNPNNIAPEASPVTTELEHEVARDLCRLVGYGPTTGWAHLCSGAHAAGYEALWIARTLRTLPQAAARHPAARDLVAGLDPVRLHNLPYRQTLDLLQQLERRGLLSEVRRPAAGPARSTLLIGRNAHYSWEKAADLLGLGGDEVERVRLDSHARLDTADLAARVHRLLRAGRPVLAVVATLGSTAEGAVDDLPAVLRLREECERRYGASFYVHVDAAYGGYFRTVCLDGEGEPLPYEQLAAPLKPEVHAALCALPGADSVTVDPHKCGRAPYPAGALVLRDRRAAEAVATRPGYFAPRAGEPMLFAPYTLEGARPGAAAAAVWAAHRAVGLFDGGYGRLLGGCLDSARVLYESFADEGGHERGDGAALVGRRPPDLSIVNFALKSGGSVDGPLLDRLSRHGVWGSVCSPSGEEGTHTLLRMCVMDPLDTPGRARVVRALRAAPTGVPAGV
ncbi:pyridoxal phosphate-dependent decarboxylase family protein [Streptomyces sp. NPDC048370]|uniref:pyridoxal phosphate-dependent decarboxylase family protein n=1 Tax=Streptomyces sp. NPDC048370 TaxID=3365540 RepID=UPI00371654CB